MPVYLVGTFTIFLAQKGLCDIDPGKGVRTAESFGGVCVPSLETCVPFQTKVCDFPFPILDLTEESISRGGGEFSHKNWVGVCGPVPKTLTLCMTKVSDFCYPVL